MKIPELFLLEHRWQLLFNLYFAAKLDRLKKLTIEINFRL